MRIFLPIGLVALSLVGCAMQKPMHIASELDVKQAEALLRPGVNAIAGSALIRQNGGGVVTCAGLPIQLVPKTDYASERLTLGFGNAQRGFSPVYSNVSLAKDEPDYYRLMQKTTCDAQGRFEFDHVADGEFFVISSIVWNVAGSSQGGSLMQAVSVSGGEIRNIVLSP